MEGGEGTGDRKRKGGREGKGRYEMGRWGRVGERGGK